MATPRILSTNNDLDFDFASDCGAGAQSFTHYEPTIADLQAYFRIYEPVTPTEWHYAIALYHYQEALIIAMQQQQQQQQQYEWHDSPAPQPQEYHDYLFASPASDDDDDDEWSYQQEHVRYPGGPQLEESEMVVTSIELPPIQDLISFPWTPVGVELPPLRGLESVKMEY